jgi:hypothetical protein
MGPKSKTVLAVVACTLLGAAAVRVGAQQPGASEPAIVGTWKLVSFLSIVDGEPPRDAFGASPKGYLIVTCEGRLMTVITSGGRKAGAGDAERAALLKSMVSYSGRYRVEGNLCLPPWTCPGTARSRSVTTGSGRQAPDRHGAAAECGVPRQDGDRKAGLGA